MQRMRLAAASQPNVTMRQAFVKRLVNAEGEEWQEGQVGTPAQHVRQYRTLQS